MSGGRRNPETELDDLMDDPRLARDERGWLRTYWRTNVDADGDMRDEDDHVRILVRLVIDALAHRDGR